ncbi:ABC transporter permease [Nonomuraea sp. NPDC050394]|uniref:ABC transporter permease n=1 Tax=Nonomuraea sp. NPDC050394 TaxID=3364363 RepID=UPI0037B71576
MSGRRLAWLVLALVILAAVTGPWWWRYGPADITAAALVPPSGAHPLGTGPLGHDLLSQVVAGTGRSLAIAVVVAILSTTAGTMAGLLAGYTGGWADAFVMRTIDLLTTIPLVAVLGLLAVRLGGGTSGWLVVALAVSAFFWAPIARVIRGVTLSLRTSDFIASARLVGASTPRILLRHLLPHLVPHISVAATGYVAAAIALESALSFLGLGVQPPDTSLGQLVGQGAPYVSTAPWLFYAPSLTIVIIVGAVHVAGDGLNLTDRRR